MDIRGGIRSCLASARGDSWVVSTILERMRELVRTVRYVMTIHALDAMEDDELTVFDVERCFLTGRIVERQRDRARREWKYLVEGWLTDGSRAAVIAKVTRTHRHMVCDICGKRGARIRRVTRSFGKGKATFLIEAVPVVSCPKCGEGYLTADTLREVERIRQKRRRLTKGRLVPVATFGSLA